MWRVQYALAKIRTAARHLLTQVGVRAPSRRERVRKHCNRSPLPTPLLPWLSIPLAQDEKSEQRIFQGDALLRRMIRQETHAHKWVWSTVVRLSSDFVSVGKAGPSPGVGEEARLRPILTPA